MSEIPKYPKFHGVFCNVYEEWRVETIKTLKKMLRTNKPYGPSPMKKELIKDFLKALGGEVKSRE